MRQPGASGLAEPFAQVADDQLDPSCDISGPNARGDVQGSFDVITANRLRFADGYEFRVVARLEPLLAPSLEDLPLAKRVVVPGADQEPPSKVAQVCLSTFWCATDMYPLHHNKR